MPENTVEESRSQQAVIVILHFSPKIRAKNYSIKYEQNINYFVISFDIEGTKYYPRSRNCPTINRHGLFS